MARRTQLRRMTGESSEADETAGAVGCRVRDRPLERAAVHQGPGVNLAREAADADIRGVRDVGCADDGALQHHAAHAAARNPAEEPGIPIRRVHDEVRDAVVLSVELARETDGGVADGRPRRAVEVDVAVLHVDAGEVVRDGDEVLDRPDDRGTVEVLFHFRPGRAGEVDVRAEHAGTGEVVGYGGEPCAVCNSDRRTHARAEVYLTVRRKNRARRCRHDQRCTNILFITCASLSLVGE